VTISDPYVSRHHASLAFREGEWSLVSVGKHGVLVGNSPVTEHPLDGEVSFRLGPSGPTLRFCTASDREEHKATITVDVETISLFLDEEKLHSEVDQIASGEYFQDLQARAAELRRRRNPRSTGG
jgi:pSer/pThr/pTyr-binding forkhead associated (FHA) protein